MKIDEVERWLREAGSDPVPEPRAAFTEALEDRLRSGALDPVSTSLSLPARRHPRRALGVLAAAAAIAAVLAFATLVSPHAGEREVRFAAATDALVVLPDGTVQQAAAGVTVPDGTRILTGDGGRVVAGGVEIGPNREALVSEGTLKTTLTTTPAPPSPPSTIRPAKDTPAATAPAAVPPPAKPIPSRPAAAPRPPTAATSPRERRDEAAPPATKPAPGPHPRPDAPTTTTTSTPATGPAHRPEVLDLVVRYKDNAVTLRWARYAGSDFAAYLVLRSQRPDEPRYPLDGSTTVVARIDNPAAARFLDRTGDPARRMYRVVAVDSQGRLLAQTPAVQPEAQPGPSR